MYAAISSTFDELIDVAKLSLAECSKDELKNVAFNAIKRTRLCVQQCGGLFQYLLNIVRFVVKY